MNVGFSAVEDVINKTTVPNCGRSVYPKIVLFLQGCEGHYGVQEVATWSILSSGSLYTRTLVVGQYSIYRPSLALGLLVPTFMGDFMH